MPCSGAPRATTSLEARPREADGDPRLRLDRELGGWYVGCSTADRDNRQSVSGRLAT
jgi:hypothetical protein